MLWSLTEFTKSGHYGMISPWGMRGKGIGSLTGQWCLRCLVHHAPVMARPKEDSAPIIRRPIGYQRTCRRNRTPVLPLLSLSKMMEGDPRAWSMREQVAKDDPLPLSRVRRNLN